MSHRLELELFCQWNQEWAKGLHFVRGIYCHDRIVIPAGSLLICWLQAGKSYRVYFILGPKDGKLDGIGVPRAGVGRIVAPWTIHPRGGDGRDNRLRSITPEVRHELQTAFGIKPSWSLRTWLSIRHWYFKKRTWLFAMTGRLASTIGGLAWRCLTAPMSLLSRVSAK